MDAAPTPESDVHGRREFSCRGRSAAPASRQDLPPACWGRSAVGVALLSALATFMVLAGLTPIIPTNDVVVTLLAVNALAVLLLLGIIGREVWHIVQARRRGRAAARLHVQIVGLVLDHRGRAGDPGRGGRERDARPRPRSAVFDPHPRVIENSLIVADAYVREHAQSIRGRHRSPWRSTCRAPSRCSTRTATGSVSSSTAQATLRGLPTAMMIDGRSTIVLEGRHPAPRQALSRVPPPRALADASARRAAGRVPHRRQLRRRGDQAAAATTTPTSTSPAPRPAGAGADRARPQTSIAEYARSRGAPRSACRSLSR